MTARVSSETFVLPSYRCKVGSDWMPNCAATGEPQVPMSILSNRVPSVCCWVQASN